MVSTPADLAVERRLLGLADGLEEVLVRERPGAVAIEKVLFNVNVRTAMATGQAAGVALLVCARRGVSVTSYAPTQVKSAVAGFGGADKAQMRSAVTRFLGLPEAPPTDAADALALALCHAAAGPLAAATAEATSAPAVGSARLRAAIAEATR